MVVNFLDFQLWQQTEPLETALQRGQARKFPGNLTFTAQILSNVVSQMISECNQELFGQFRAILIKAYMLCIYTNFKMQT